VEAKVHSENITKILYPNDTSTAGKTLRLQQEHFFVSCALQDCIRLLLQRVTIHEFADKFAIQLNDTHPSLAVPELMRLLVDVHGLGWDDAWRMTTRTISYTNHTLLPEALETWPLPLFQKLLPRHLEIILEINYRFLDEVRKNPQVTEEQVRRLSIIDELGERSVRMANLATVASHTVNGVAKLHSSLLQTTILSDFAALTPERFTNVTNGVTPRRFIALANPGLRGLLDEAVGPGWLTDLERLRALEPLAEDGAFRERWRAVKRANKESLASWLRSVHNLSIDPSALLDAQCKRIHEYKRQLLNLLHVVWLGERLKEGVPEGFAPRTILLAGKAAPSYRTAKLIIRLSHGIADALASDPRTRDLLRVVFVPDFNVKNAQRIYPAADLSEQISTAGMEASGTGNMKFTLNGALTIGTLDGANVEIRDAVGADHFFLFGLTTEEVEARRLSGADPRVLLDADPELAEVIRLLTSGRFAPDVEVFRPIAQSLLEKDHFCVLADFRAYLASQQLVGRAFRDETAWCRSSILNVARAGCFSSDRSIREYAERIWKVSPVAIRGA
jgi:starch phosphorylase